jgi:SAM-dependent methyltransferase
MIVMATMDVPLTPFGDVVDVVRAAIDLGAARCGGPLSPTEKQYVGWARLRNRTPRDFRDRLREQILVGLDPLGDALLALRDRDRRRKMGAFFTPPEIVEPMVSWALDQEPDLVVDPGCGSGRFAAAVARRSPTTRVVAVDRDEISTLITRAVLAVLKSPLPKVLNRDFLDLERIPRKPKARVAWLGNPPYVRHHRLTLATKRLGIDLAHIAKHDSQMIAGLHVLFFTKTRLLAKPGDVGCYVTAAEWMDNRSGSVVRDLFLNGLGGQRVVVVDPESFAFEGVKTTAALTRFVVGLHGTEKRFAINVPLDDLHLENRESDLVATVATLEASRGWTRTVTNPGQMQHGGPTIGDLFHVSRGTATGSNAYFVMTAAEAKERGLERLVVPVVNRAEQIMNAGGSLSKGAAGKVVLDIPRSFDRKLAPRVDAYLALGERPGADGLLVSAGSNAQKRTPWFSIGLVKPPIVATYMARRPPVFALNPDGLGVLNIAIGITPRVPMTPEQMREVVAALNAAAADYVSYATTYFGNLKKFEPKVLAALPLPEALHPLVPAKR